MSDTFQQHGSGNVVELGANVEVTGFVSGNNNRIVVADADGLSRLHVMVNGDGNRIVVERNTELKGLMVSCGNHVRAHDTELHIGENTTVEAGGRFFLYNSGNVLRIGRNCMLSSGITIRCGESPHLLFNRDTGEYLDASKGVVIGEHVWIGEGAYLTKSAAIADDCIVGARSVVTRRFAQTHTAIAGNPARVVREGVQWIRNPGMLEPGSLYEESYRAHMAAFPRAAAPPPAPVRLDLGFGASLPAGHVNVDAARALPFDDGHADEIVAAGVIERFYRWEAFDVLADWVRVLKPGGRLVLETPNLLAACAEVVADPTNAAAANAVGGIGALYGSPLQGDPATCHRWLYTPQSLAQLLHEAGLRQLAQTPPQFEARHPRDMRIQGTKPAP